MVCNVNVIFYITYIIFSVDTNILLNYIIICNCEYLTIHFIIIFAYI